MSSFSKVRKCITNLQFLTVANARKLKKVSTFGKFENEDITANVFFKKNFLKSNPLHEIQKSMTKLKK